MPKTTRNQPLSCLFAINKPTGQVSMQLLNQLQPLFSSSSLFRPVAGANAQHPNDKTRRSKWKKERIKIGQGGTLDPLADGVLVVGVNNATKQLSKFLDCTKEYRAIGLLGCSTDSYDSDGKRVKLTSFEGITKESIEGVLDRFRGEIEQVPPIFSALKMDGKPLYEYARTKTPLPRPIAARKTTIHDLKLLSFTPGDQHSYQYPEKDLEKEEKEQLARLEKMVKESGTVIPDVVDGQAEEAEEEFDPSVRPPIFEISLTVSSGTYVRSIIHDIAIALNSSAHVVKLTRTRQGQFVLQDPEPKAEGEGEVKTVVDEGSTIGCVAWETLETAMKDLQEKKKSGKATTESEDEYGTWETEILSKCQEV